MEDTNYNSSKYDDYNYEPIYSQADADTWIHLHEEQRDKIGELNSEIAALKAENERLKEAIGDVSIERVAEICRAEKEPCEYCKPLSSKYLYIDEFSEPRIFFDINGKSLRYFDEDYPGKLDSFDISYCPNCGRKL